MAAPPEVTIKNLSGRWGMNTRLGDDQQDFFILQGLGWMTRNAIKLATVTLNLKQFEQDGETHIEIDQNAAPLSTSKEYRILTWVLRPHDDKLFGKLEGRSRFFQRSEFQIPEGMEISDEDKKFLLGEILKDGSESSFLPDDTHIQTVAINEKDGWVVDQVWGFEEINGERRYTRRLICKKEGNVERMRLVYDYLGPATE